MAANAPETPVQALVVFVVESTAVNGQFINELKTNYLLPTLEYFHGGVIDEGGGCGSLYALVTYKAADSLLNPVSVQGPFTCPQTVLQAVDAIQFISGQAESRACVTEALVAALSCLDDFGRSDLPRHILLLCCSPPYSAFGGGLVPPGMPTTIEQAARLVSERGAVLSIVAARRLNALSAIFEFSGGDLLQAQQRNYAKDPKHLVLLRGYSLKERPPSPAPPPVPEIQTEVPYGQRQPTPGVRPPAPQAFPRAGAPAVGAGVGPMAPGGQVGQVGPVGQVGNVGQVGQVGAVGGPGVRGNWLAPPRQPLYSNNSALLSQLAQPSYPPPPQPQQQQNMQRMGMAGPGAAPGPPQRTYIWSGVLEWMEKGKAPGDHQKLTKHLPCQVSANSKDIEPELKVETWPNKLLMQLMPKQLISTIGGQYLKDSKSVLFHLQPNEALDALTKVMVNGFAGCVHFSSPPQCDIKVLILLYTPDKKAFLGFIPNNQATFVDRLRKVIQQQKIINKQQLPAVSSAGGMPPSMPSQPIPGTSGMGGGMAGGMGGVPVNVPQSSQPMVNHPQQGMMMPQGMSGQVGQVGQVPAQGKGRGQQVPQLDGLEAARQQNLEKIQQLQQTLEAAHQQEAQFKSQMDIMSHLHAAQQQEHHYKQLEEQRKHQLQQQLQQQLRTAQGVGGVGVGVGAGMGGVPPRCVVRPMMSSNPGLRHLLQQPQYRPGGNGPRPPNQQQPFDDVNNYDFM